jgi:maleate cis-trans isomerase
LAFTSWRGTVGLVKPSKGSMSYMDLARLLPDGIGLIPVYLNIHQRTIEEYRAAIPKFEEKVAELAAQQVDFIHPEGAPPFVAHGFKKEAQIVRGWVKKYKVPIATTGMTQVAAMKALGIKRFVGLSPQRGKMTELFTKYYGDAGHQALSMNPLIPPWVSLDGLSILDIYKLTINLSAEEVYAGAKAAVIKAKGRPQAIYIHGSSWPVLEVIDMIERDTGLPVLFPTIVRCWYIQKALNVRYRIENAGILLREMP